MIATIVNIWVKHENLKEFIDVSKKNHLNSIKEPGNLKFDILQDASDSCKFTFYEVYESEEDIIAHKNTTHYKEWRDSVAHWMARTREGIKHYVLFPIDKSLW
jgi:autoinducer 2-degrading protein